MLYIANETFLFSPDMHVCNGSLPHTADIGDILTYSCHFKYRGKRAEPVMWTGPGVTKDNVYYTLNQSTEEINPDCFQGKQRQYINAYDM